MLFWLHFSYNLAKHVLLRDESKHPRPGVTTSCPGSIRTSRADNPYDLETNSPFPNSPGSPIEGDSESPISNPTFLPSLSRPHGEAELDPREFDSPYPHLTLLKAKCDWPRWNRQPQSIEVMSEIESPEFDDTSRPLEESPLIEAELDPDKCKGPYPRPKFPWAYSGPPDPQTHLEWVLNSVLNHWTLIIACKVCFGSDSCSKLVFILYSFQIVSLVCFQWVFKEMFCMKKRSFSLFLHFWWCCTSSEKQFPIFELCSRRSATKRCRY